MQLVPITPSGDKVERLRKHRSTIRLGLIQLYGDFISEATQFPYDLFDDQMDALSQYLTWPSKRPPIGIIQGVDYQNRPIHLPANVPNTQTKFGVVRLCSRMMPNAPFLQDKPWVKC